MGHNKAIMIKPIVLICILFVGQTFSLLSPWDPFLGILKLLKEGDKYWKTEKRPDACAVAMGTEAGGNCWAYVDCQGDKKEYKDWNVCYLNGRQFFTDERIGDFSITFSKAGIEPEDKDGLYGPILQLKEVGDFAILDVEAEGGNEYDSTGSLCTRGLEGDESDSSLMGKKLAWICAVPKSGKSVIGLESNIQVDPSVGYATGSCGVHVTHYQIPEGPDNYYSIETQIKDANGDQIGEISRTTATGPINISSKLPYQLIVTTALPGSVPDTDAEPVNFAYGGDSWNSGDQTRCSQGGYENGARNIDCGFAC